MNVFSQRGSEEVMESVATSPRRDGHGTDATNGSAFVSHTSGIVRGGEDHSHGNSDWRESIAVCGSDAAAIEELR